MFSFKKFFSFFLIYFSLMFNSLYCQWSLDTVVSTGGYPSGIAITPDNSKLVVTSKTSPGSVRIISTSDYSIKNIDVSSIEDYPDGVAVTPNDSLAIVNTMHNTIFINLFTNSITGHYAAPCASTTLYGIAVTSNGKSAVYPDLSSGCTQQGIRIIDAGGSASGSSFINVNTSGELYGIALTPDGGSAIVTTSTMGSPKNVNIQSSTVLNISGINGSYGVAAFHKSNEALIFDGDSLCRVSLSTNSVTKKICALTYNTAFQNIAITADDKYAFAVGAFEKLIISLPDDSVIQTFTAGGTNVACTSDGSKFFVTDAYNGTVRVYKKTATAVEQNTGQAMKGFLLEQNYPNPFNPSTEIIYRLPISAIVTLKLYDMLGREAATLINGFQQAGEHKVKFNADNLTSGIYFYNLKAGNFIATKKLIILK